MYTLVLLSIKQVLPLSSNHATTLSENLGKKKKMFFLQQKLPTSQGSPYPG
jgi:hypothetical protein